MDMNMPTMPMQKAEPSTLGNITEFPLNWPLTGDEKPGSTHELIINDQFIFVTGQNMNKVAKFNYQGELLTYYNMEENSAPHGLLIDIKGRLWVSLESLGQVVRLDENGNIVQRIDVKIYPNGTSGAPVNTAPHGIGLDADGETIWFTGKRTSTIGKISPDGQVTHFQLETLAALPIFLSSGNGTGMWGTELLGNNILNISPEGKVSEYAIPTSNSRPIAIIKDPVENCMWFTQEAGLNIGRIDADGKISEYPIPVVQQNSRLASLCFDDEMNLWVQVYVDLDNPKPAGSDYLLKFDKSIRTSCGFTVTGVPFTTHVVPSRSVMMHRIRKDKNGNLWFTEMMLDRLGKITL